jgi:hypothetical protein
MPVDGEVELLEPDPHALAGLLRSSFRDEAARLTRGRAAAERARAWTWDVAAERIIERCRVLGRTIS